MTLIGSIVVPVTNEGGPLLDLGGPDMSHSWKLPALAAVIAVVAMTSTQPVIADGTLEVGESVVTAPDNGYTFTKVMATGTVFSPSGEALQGAVVNVYAEPGMDVLRGLKEGDTYQRSLVGAAVSDQSGRYSIEPDYAALADASDPTEKGQSAPINVTFVVTSPGALTAYGATIWYSPGENVAAMASLETSGGARVADSRAGMGPGLDFHLEKAVGAAQSQDAMAASIPSNCSIVTNYGARSVYVGQTSSTVSGADSTLGMGYSLTGNAGTWSQSGTSVASSSSTTNFPASSASGSNLMVTKFTFAKVRCYAGVVPTFYYQVRPTDFYGGATTLSTTTPSATYCAPYSAGSGFSRTTSNAVTYTNGVQVSAVIGINLTAQTGFRGAPAPRRSS